ncbi:unnamed protein product [Rotaria magnacalcarata]|uniref:Uncharacterized protein n=1 Tax=Rotaria magnacalcarata TaxID=392030 RepID=A0A820EHE0_9BILA|nr:unnamed protein product [Rotaria magnacalcarata]CAF2052622.1 unnamed protein product [Rotaria magnacalcarata]CAF3873263.1 unnamed protein product [Rotaria magnacalcarata]CAF4248616.1 unnamed protein product [Rotaria magnacalcarata]
MSQDIPINDLLPTVLKEIQQFNEGDLTSKQIALEGLDAKQRYKVYSTIETQYSGRLAYEKQSLSNGQQKQVFLILTKTTNATDEIVIRKPLVDHLTVLSFQKYTQLPLPLANNMFFDYYLDVLDPYTGCRATFAQFLKDIEIHETIYKLNDRINRISENIIHYLIEHPSVQAFKQRVFDEEMALIQTSKYKSKKTVYTPENQDKLFISVDINKAYYNVLKHYYPEVFRNLATWQEFVNTFCDEQLIHTLSTSKFLRLITFSKAIIRTKVNSLSEYFIHKVLHEMSVPYDKIVMLSGDEFVIPYDRDMYDNLFGRYHGTFFKVLAFRLVKLPKYNYFVKEHFNPTDESVITHRELKCIPQVFIVQCIKQYEGKAILEVDRKFMAERNYVATFDKSIF